MRKLDHLKSVKPLLAVVVLVTALSLSFQIYHSVGGLPSVAFLTITTALICWFIFVPRLRRMPAGQPGFVESIPGLGWASDGNGRMSTMNSRMREFLKVSPNSVIVPGASIHPEDRHKTLDLLTHKHSSEKRGTHRLLGPDGRYHWFISVVQPVHDENGMFVSSWGTFVDIGDLKAAEEKLRGSEQNLRSILDNIPGHLATADANGVNDYCNRIGELFYGQSFHELNGMGFTHFVHPDDIDEYVTYGLYRIANALPFDRAVRLRRHDGVYRWFRMRVNPAFDANGKVVRWYGLHSDIDDEVRAIESLQQAQEKLANASELASLAELAASVAHEVNQPLSAVVLNSQACQAWLSADPPNLNRAQASSDRIVRDAKEAADVVRRIRELFSQKVPDKVHININKAIVDVVQVIRKKHANSGLVVNLDLDVSSPQIIADRVQVQQVLFNIVRNGVEAMQLNDEEAMTLDIRSRVAGGKVVVEVIDNGSGVVDPHKIFEPFFTTKSNGMGIGLSICRSIIDAHKGHLWAEARLTRGAMFAFELPIDDAVSLQDSDP